MPNSLGYGLRVSDGAHLVKVGGYTCRERDRPQFLLVLLDRLQKVVGRSVLLILKAVLERLREVHQHVVHCRRAHYKCYSYS